MAKRIVQIDEFFGQLIAAKRKKLGMDQKELSGKLGIMQPALSRIERGESSVNTAMLIKLSGALKTTSTELIREFEHEKSRLERDEAIELRAKKDLPSNKATLGKVLLGGAALALLLGTVNK